MELFQAFLHVVDSVLSRNIFTGKCVEHLEYSKIKDSTVQPIFTPIWPMKWSKIFKPNPISAFNF